MSTLMPETTSSFSSFDCVLSQLEQALPCAATHALQEAIVCQQALEGRQDMKPTYAGGTRKTDCQLRSFIKGSQPCDQPMEGRIAE